jgi:hypothetical protein
MGWLSDFVKLGEFQREDSTPDIWLCVAHVNTICSRDHHFSTQRAWQTCYGPYSGSVLRSNTDRNYWSNVSFVWTKPFEVPNQTNNTPKLRYHRGSYQQSLSSCFPAANYYHQMAQMGTLYRDAMCQHQLFLLCPVRLYTLRSCFAYLEPDYSSSLLDDDWPVYFPLTFCRRYVSLNNLLIAIWHKTVISATADFVLAILPWHILWGLQMKKKDKIFIASSMSLGLL